MNPNTTSLLLTSDLTAAPPRRLSRRFFYPALIATFQITRLTTLGSDHIDSPTLAQDRGTDIADLYAFLDPNDSTTVILIMSTQGFVVSGEHFGMGIFDPNVRYRFEIENTGDARPDLFVDVRYSVGLGRLTSQTATITVSDHEKGYEANSPKSYRPGRSNYGFMAETTIATQEPQPTPPPAPLVSTDAASGIEYYGGVADDPFFFDDTGANRFVASSIMNPGNPDKTLFGFRLGRDTYAGFNTMITAVSIPVALVSGKAPLRVIGVNAVTQRRKNQKNKDGAVEGSGGWVTVDRQGNPLVNNGLISAPRKNEYNGASTRDDERGKFRADITRNLQNLATDAAHITAILGVIQVNGDILRLDLDVPNTGTQGGNNAAGGFGRMGGRRLVDDVGDIVFTLINNEVLLTDFVNANEVPFRNDFPFVSDPTQPFPPGNDPDDHTRQ